MKRFMDGKETYHILYENVSEFFELTDPKNPAPDVCPNNLKKHKDIMSGGRDSWRYGDEGSRSEYLKHRFDSTKGKKLCAEELSKVLASGEYRKLISQAISFRKRMTFEDHGNRINVAKAISGEDRYFTTYKNTKRPTVKIAINIGGSCSVSQEAFIDIAKTAIPTIYALEMAGICTEVYYTAFTSGVFEDRDVARRIHTAVKLKSAQERFNWTTFAPVFTLGAFRESLFLAWTYSPFEVESGLGRPMDTDDIKKQDNFGYTAIIGLNAVGPVKQINELFSKLGKA